VISLCGVIVNNVQNDFDAGRVEIAHHSFELGNLLAIVHYSSIALSGAKKPIVL